MNQLLSLPVLLALLAGGLLLFGVREALRLRRVRRARKDARAALRAGDARRAVDLLLAARQRERNARRLRPLLTLEVAAREQLADLGGLVALHEQYPESFLERESAALALGRALLGLGAVSGYEGHRERWRRRAKDRLAWVALDTDALRQRGAPEAARALLTGMGTRLETDARLLARMGLLLVAEDPARAQKLFKQAHRIRPDDAEVYRLHGEACALSGAQGEAVSAYQRAVALAPKDPFIRDTLADIYRRQGDAAKAMAVWTAGLAPPSMPFLWLRVLFWRRTLVPFRGELSTLTEPEGAEMPLVHFLRALPPAKFWDAQAFEAIALRNPALAERQEVHWLRLLDAFRHGREDDAFSLLNLGGFGTASWAPHLEQALLRVVAWRRMGFMPASQSGAPGTPPRHPFLAGLEALAQGAPLANRAEFETVLQSPNVFSCAFLAAGWHRAGLRLHQRRHAANMPAWYTEDLATAVRVCEHPDSEAQR